MYLCALCMYPFMVNLFCKYIYRRIEKQIIWHLLETDIVFVSMSAERVSVLQSRWCAPVLYNIVYQLKPMMYMVCVIVKEHMVCVGVCTSAQSASQPTYALDQSR